MKPEAVVDVFPIEKANLQPAMLVYQRLLSGRFLPPSFHVLERSQLIHAQTWLASLQTVHEKDREKTNTLKHSKDLTTKRWSFVRKMSL